MNSYFYQLIGVIMNVMAAHVILYATFEIKKVSILAILMLLLAFALMYFGTFNLKNTLRAGKSAIFFGPMLVMFFSFTFIKISALGDLLGFLFAITITITAIAINKFSKIISHEP